jgi:acid phosphatase family membrane protein YuiD
MEVLSLRDIFSELYANRPLWIAVSAFFIAQLIKMIIEFKKLKKVSLALLVSSGGMPSSHTAFVTAMCTAIGMSCGFDSAFFAVSAVLSLIVMYDAAGVRRAAGNQAAAINMLIANLENPNIALDKKLKELLGHSPVEVAAGLLLGVCTALILS